MTTTNKEARFQVILIGHGGVVAKEFLDTPYHNSDWPTYRGDKVSVYDRQEQEWLPDYTIQQNSYFIKSHTYNFFHNSSINIKNYTCIITNCYVESTHI